MHQRPHAPYCVDERGGGGGNGFGSILRLLFGRDSETRGTAGRRGLPSAERVRETPRGGLGFGRGYDVRHDRDAVEGVASRRRAAVQRAEQVGRLYAACAIGASERHARDGSGEKEGERG